MPQKITKIDEDDNKKVSKQIEINSKTKADPETANKCEKVFKAVSAEVKRLNDALKT